MWGALPDGAHLWLHVKPLDAAIGQVPAPHFLVGHHGQRICCKHKTTFSQYLLYFFTRKRSNFQDQKKKKKALLSSWMQQVAQKM